MADQSLEVVDRLPLQDDSVHLFLQGLVYLRIMPEVFLEEVNDVLNFGSFDQFSEFAQNPMRETLDRWERQENVGCFP